MSGNLSEMTLEELWQLFPIVLREYDPSYKEWYACEKENILAALSGRHVMRINHIGSTAVEGLTGKPTVDILLELLQEADWNTVRTQLTQAGWILMASQNPPDLRLIFNKGYTSKGYDERVFHLHVRYLGDWDELYFRDYLAAHQDLAREYEILKQALQKRFMHDRDKYTAEKTEFVSKYTKLARTEFGGRYQTKHDSTSVM